MTEPGIGLRVVRPEDIPALRAIHDDAVRTHRTAHGAPLPAEAWETWLDDRDLARHPILVAVDSATSTPVGYATLSDYRPGRRLLAGVAEVSYFVAESHRRRGLATRLVEACLERAPAVGYHTVIAILFGDNAPSLALLEKLGFEEWGRMPGIGRVGERVIDHVYQGRSVESPA